MRLVIILLTALLTGCEVSYRNPSTLTSNITDPWQTIFCGSERSPKDDITIYRRTSRLKVPTGWIYRTTSETSCSHEIIETSTFVLDPFHDSEGQDSK